MAQPRCWASSHLSSIHAGTTERDFCWVQPCCPICVRFCKACSLLRARCEHGIGGMKKVLSAGFRGPEESETGHLAVKSPGEGDRERRLEAAADVCSSHPP